MNSGKEHWVNITALPKEAGSPQQEPMLMRKAKGSEPNLVFLFTGESDGRAVTNL